MQPFIVSSRMFFFPLFIIVLLFYESFTVTFIYAFVTFVVYYFFLSSANSFMFEGYLATNILRSNFCYLHISPVFQNSTRSFCFHEKFALG